MKDLKSMVSPYFPTDPLAANTRVKMILKHVPKDGKVLDIGCVNHSLDNDDQNWLHGQLSASTGRVVGMDYLASEIETMRKEGYNVVLADAEDFSLDETFDTIVAGELIEHLSNPGDFLDQVHAHLKSSGRFVLSTPNPFYLFTFLAAGSGNADWNDEHTAWFDEQVLRKLLQRHGFVVDSVTYVEPSPWKWMFVHKNLERWLAKLLRALGAESLSGNRIVVVASPA